MAKSSFSASVEGWAAQTKERSEAVFKASAQRVISVIQTPGPSVANPAGGEGGNMPIDTGFLRASIQANLAGGLPILRDNPGGKYTYDGGQIDLVLAAAKLGDKITVAYGANYARHMEERYAFVRLGAQQWPQVVREVAAEAQARTKA